MSVLRVALLQLKVGVDKVANIQNAVTHIADAAKKGAEFIVLPECFQTPYGTKYFPEYAEEIPTGETCQAMQKAAKEHGVTVLAGSIPECEGTKVFNTSVAFGKDGSFLSKFRKMHLFKLNTEKVKFDESETLTAGSKTATFAVPVGAAAHTVGMGICFDIRFPELAALYQQSGTSILAYPGAFNMVTGPVHWELAARARAVDAQQFVVLCSPARDEQSVSGYVAYGHSMVVDPWGTVIAEAGEGEETVMCEIDLTKVAEVRGQLPTMAGKRHDLYGISFSPKEE
eukprot:NODE_5271_length_963_cov_29.020238_g5056_i0.p1 GENE.NODE_5271_length_963_cov_29.020238_g5056_i0~~NODE_5271_length_963_cov_29.020238_g5056_i0.p1  ORF type:complete len:285 (-),score=52.02 NODE_5271_length_963_cov_29.020238_g5056_i0:54-908(-)